MESEYSSSNKWVDYNKINPHLIIVPTLLIFLLSSFISSFIFSSYSILQINTFYPVFFGVIFIISFTAYYLMNKHFFRKKCFRIMFFTMLIVPQIIIILQINFRMQNSLSPTLKDQTFYIKSINYYRYSKLVILKSTESNFTCSAFFPSDFSIHKCDIIFGKANFKYNSCKTDFERYLKIRGIHYLANFNLYNIEKCAYRPMNPIEKFSEYIFQKIDFNFKGRAAALSKALIFGNKSFLSKYTLYCYKRAGALAVISASGLHVGIIALIPFFILNLFMIPKRFSMIIISLILLFYLNIANFPISLLRACLMFWIYTFQKNIFKYHNIFNTLFLSGIIILLLFPEEIFNLGFQLSFSATFGILLFFRSYQKCLKPLPSKLKQSLSLSLSAQSCVYPILLLHLNEINFAGIFTNILIIPATALSFILSLISIFTPNTFIFHYFIKYIYNKSVFLSFSFVELISKSNLHFYLLPVPSVIIGLLLFNIILPLIPLKNKFVFAITILLVYTSAFYMCNSLTKFNYYNKIQAADNTIYLYNHKNSMNISEEKMISTINKTGFCYPVLILNNENSCNLSKYYSLIKKIHIKKIFICGDISFDNNYSKLLKLFEKENIEAKLIEIDKLYEILQNGFIGGNGEIIHPQITHTQESDNWNL